MASDIYQDQNGNYSHALDYILSKQDAKRLKAERRLAVAYGYIAALLVISFVVYYL